jgi:hypothetical protein
VKNAQLFVIDFFQFSSPEEAEGTISALDGVKWPTGTPKQVRFFLRAKTLKLLALML